MWVDGDPKKVGLVSRGLEGFQWESQPGGHGSGKGRGSVPTVGSVDEFCTESSPAKHVESLEQKLHSSSGFVISVCFLFLILASLTQYLISSAVKFKPPFFTFFLSTNFLSSLSSSNATPFSYTLHTPARSPHLPLKGTKNSLLGLMPESWVSWKIPPKLP